LHNAETAVRTAQRAIADAQKALTDARKGGTQLDLAKAQLALRTGQVALESAKESRADLDTGADPTELATAQADVDKKQLAVDDAQKALDATQIKAPFDGTVTQTKVRAGDKITANTVILTVADLHRLQVFALVDETTIRRVQQGQTAQISFDAFPGQTFKGTVLSVPLQGELQNDVLVYQVPLSLEGADELPLLVGMTANVSIQTAEVENALLVPTLALTRTRGGYQVAVVNPNDPSAPPEMREVEVGLSDGQFTQIVQGLQAGEQVQVTFTPTQNNGNPFFRGGFGAVPFGGGFGGGNQPRRNNNSGGNTRP
jgi:RND family efflux transporter MFP subunit